MRRGVIVGSGAAAAVAGAVVAMLLPGGGGADRVTQQPLAAPAATQETTTPLTDPPEPVPTTSAPKAARPSPSPSPFVPDADAPPPVDGVASTPDPARPAGYPLPECASYGRGCAYPGATGATSGDVVFLDGSVVEPRSVRAVWRPADPQPRGWAHPTEFVVYLGRLVPGKQWDGQVISDRSRVVRVRVPWSQRSHTFRDLLPGHRYVIWVQELNSAGLSAGVLIDEVFTIPEPSPSATRTPSATPTPSAAPTATPSATATAGG